MSADKLTAPAGRDDARQVVRQFAWNLAGSLAKTKSARSRPARRTSMRKRVVGK